MKRALLLMFLCILGIAAKADSTLPFAEALDFIKNADAVYLCYSPSISDRPRTQADRSKWEKVFGNTKQQLIDIFSQKDNYFKGSWGVSEGPAADHIRVFFQKGTTNLVLTCGFGILDGTFHR